MSDNEILIPDVLDPEFSYDDEKNKPHKKPHHKHECEQEDKPRIRRTRFDYRDIENFQQRVCSCMGQSTSSLTQEELDYPEHAPLAEYRVKKIIPNWRELDDAKFALFQSCIIFMTCYIMCPVVNSRRISKQTTPSLTLQYADSAVQATPCDHYLDLMNDLAEEILEEETDAFYGFRVTKSSDCHRRAIWPTRLPH